MSMANVPCAEPIYRIPRRNLFRGELPINPRTVWMARHFCERHVDQIFPPGYMERLATRGGLVRNWDDEDDD